MLKEISKDMIIGEIVSMFPEAAEIIQSYGVHCVGCHANAFETLEQGILGHGFSEEDLQELVDELNEYREDINAQGGDPNKLPPEADSFQISVTEAAKKQVMKVMKKEEKEGIPLRITLRVVSGMFKYGMNFLEEDEELNDFDRLFSFDDGKIQIVLDKRDHKKLRDLEIDFVKEEDRAGFKMNNPNAKI